MPSPQGPGRPALLRRRNLCPFLAPRWLRVLGGWELQGRTASVASRYDDSSRHKARPMPKQSKGRAASIRAQIVDMASAPTAVKAGVM